MVPSTFRVVLAPFLAIAAWGQLTFTVPIVDRSGPGSPLDVFGSASFTEHIAGSSIRVTAQYEVGGRNKSTKTILLIVASMDVMAPHGTEQHHTVQVDNLFRAGIGPEETFVLARSVPEEDVFPCCVSLSAPPNDPHVEIRVQYVRFNDGTAIGDDSAAKDISEVESRVLEKLRALNAARGDVEFRQVLGERVDRKEADLFLQPIRESQREQGTAAARDQVRLALQHAEEHLAELTKAQTGKR